MAELKPCPFCGGTVSHELTNKEAEQCELEHIRDEIKKEIKKEFDNMCVTRYKIHLAKGKCLNKIAEIFRLKRKFLESDKRLRKRILKQIDRGY